MGQSSAQIMQRWCGVIESEPNFFVFKYFVIFQILYRNNHGMLHANPKWEYYYCPHKRKAFKWSPYKLSHYFF